MGTGDFTLVEDVDPARFVSRCRALVRDFWTPVGYSRTPITAPQQERSDVRAHYSMAFWKPHGTPCGRGVTEA